VLVVFLIISLILVVGVYVLIVRAGGLRFPWIQFYVRGKESGFTFSEIGLLRNVATANHLKQPTSLFWSVKTLDRCIRSAIVGFRSANATDNPRNMEFLNKLFDFRARVEFSQPKYRLGLSSTRGITPGQMLKITLAGGGVYLSKLVETNRRYMAITYPRGKALPTGFSWRKQTLKIYFWRQEDAGYYFESNVIGDYLDRKVPILHVAHVDSLVRTQKRKSVRRQVGKAAALYPLKSITQANETVERSGSYRCKLIDISEDGAALAVGGKVKAGMPVKIQARIGDNVLILNGVVKSVNFQKKNNVSVLHVEGQKPSTAMRIKILTFVYGLFESDRKEGKSRSAGGTGSTGGTGGPDKSPRGSASASATASPSPGQASAAPPAGEKDAAGE
jgi:c-di-GMP-binding flagellar brake protein YcgR